MIAPCVIAVVVTYHPDQAGLARLLHRLSLQVQHTVVVDNTSGTGGTSAPLPHLGSVHPTTTWLPLGHNTGIGHAQNLGVEEARRRGATHVLFMDQDSLPPDTLVPHLLQTLATAPLHRVAAIGPVCRDVKTGHTTPLIQRHGWRVRRVCTDGLTAPVPVEYIPASGTLVPLPMLDRVGLLRADYFIDRVDVEWCLRARHQGLAVWVDPRTEMQHDQATRTVRLLGRTLYVGRDFRAYFHVRNSVAMALRADIPMLWRVDQFLKTVPYVLLYTLAAEQGRLRMAGALVQAVVDGVRGRMGLGRYETRPLR